MSFFQIDMADLRTFFCHFQCSHSFGALFSLHEQVVHGNLALDVVGIASGLDAIGGDHRQVDGLRCDAYYAVFLLVISRIMCTFALNSRKGMRQTPEVRYTKLPNEQIKLHVYG